MTNTTPQALFREAATLIERALAGLDATESECPHCHDRRFTNFAHAKARRAFADTPAKLREHAATIDAKSQHVNGR